MHIIVCIKQVPDVAEIKFDLETRTIVREGVRGIVNPFDRSAIALAVDLKQRLGATTTVVTMGPPAAAEALYEGLASGLDRAVHLCDAGFAGSDTLATARALSAFMRREPFQLILCGKHTIDGETAQVGPELAELVGIPHLAGVSKVRISDDGRAVIAERETDEGHEEVQVPLPCLLTAAEHLLPPVPVRKPMLDQARSQPITRLGVADLALSSEDVGRSGSPTWVEEIRVLPPIERPKVRFLSGSIAEMAEELAAALRNLPRQERALEPVPLSKAAPSDQPVRERPDTRRDVWVVVERDAGGELTTGTRELLGKAQELLQSLSGEAVAVLFGSVSEALLAACAEAGADAVVSLEAGGLAAYDSQTYAAALCQSIERLLPHTVLFSSSERGRDLAPRVAARLQLGLTGDAVGLLVDDARRLVALKPAFSGNIVAPILSRTYPQMATVRPGVFPLRPQNPQRRARRQPLPVSGLPPAASRILHSTVTTQRGAESLTAARTVIGVGMGIGGPDNVKVVRELAERLGAAIAITRRVADSGWLPRQLQVGLTGKVIAPDVYIAVGVRGVGNHTIGIQRAGTIIAVNKDEKAPIFQLANYGIVADWAEFLPALIAAVG